MIKRVLNVSSYYATLGISYEEYDFISFLRCRKLGFYALHSVGIVESRQIEVAVYLLYVANLLIAVATASQTN